jgi:hypothetical protein
VLRLARSCPNCHTSLRRVSLDPIKLKSMLYDVAWVLVHLVVMVALGWGIYRVAIHFVLKTGG